MKRLLICCIALSIAPCMAMDTKTEAKDLSLQLKQYYQQIDTAETRKDLKEYISLIGKILPPDISRHITAQWIDIVIKTEAIKNKHTCHTFLTISNTYNLNNPKLIMSPNGRYFIHNIAQDFTNSEFELCNTQSNTPEYQFKSQHRMPAYFSPKNNYIITRELDGVNLYHIKTKQKHLLLNHPEASYDIIISPSSKYILHEGRHAIADSTPVYTLWQLDQSHKPQKVSLKDNLMGSYSALFHPNNEQLYHTKGNLHLYDIATQQDHALTLERPYAHACLAHNLRFVPDTTHMICDAWIDGAEQFIERHALLNIQNLENVTTTEIPPASLDKKTSFTSLCTAFTHLITHICNTGKTLQLLDKNMKLLASHQAKDSYISAIAIDNTGNCLASGYSDGTIILWDISTPHKAIHGKKLMGSQGHIKNLTFTDNHLLLSQSKIDQTFGTAILWDTKGNQILNFGNAVLAGKISKNGKKVAIIYGCLTLNHARKYLNVYNLHVPVDNYTLEKGYDLFAKYNT